MVLRLISIDCLSAIFRFWLTPQAENCTFFVCVHAGRHLRAGGAAYASRRGGICKPAGRHMQARGEALAARHRQPLFMLRRAVSHHIPISCPTVQCNLRPSEIKKKRLSPPPKRRQHWYPVTGKKTSLALRASPLCTTLC